ncbi:hypothetical protein SS50377_20505 [Spironucleus salmonicida]|uniref:Uncharacterized protein n=1 Tax=Spironucleus salmonicida TaxID=348837 RepID=A0A9P8LYY5_9EUKA|nr:hypothetical protein SS50377_20505 [Spironucleus salmonicida]
MGGVVSAKLETHSDDHFRCLDIQSEYDAIIACVGKLQTEANLFSIDACELFVIEEELTLSSAF